VTDHSHLDKRYFVDGKTYNCPYCNRNHVPFYATDSFRFDWTERKKCYGYCVECQYCSNTSMHLTFTALPRTHEVTRESNYLYSFNIKDADPGTYLDGIFFYSVPTSFFVLDERVPRKLRELLTESEGCLKSNYLTGASACARKVVYELGILQDAIGNNYEDRIKSLKSKLPNIDPTYFDTLLTIQELTSTKVHDGAYDGWESKHLRVILSSLAEVLSEIYMIPALRADRRQAIIDLRDELTPKAQSGSTPEGCGAEVFEAAEVRKASPSV
jgi:hypothetical protein